jgi:electron-transferring-flavoprotein dehydrogenase
VDINFDVVFVGAGPASLAGAIHLKKLARATKGVGDLSVAVIEKAPGLGDHSLSGATFDTRALEELIPNFMEMNPPLGPVIKSEGLYFLTKRHRLPIPLVPPPMSNKGKRLVSLSDLVRWLGRQAEACGVEIYTSEAADEILMEKDRVVGVRIKGKGIGKDGLARKNSVGSTDVGAKVVILGEGARGHLTKRLIKRLGLCKDSLPQGHAVGLKELWEIHEDAFVEGRIMNCMGYPVPLDTFGGAFIYFIKERMAAVGLVVGLDWKRPKLHPFKLLQQFKAHPYIAKILKGGRFVAYGAKTIAEGGYYARPKSFGDGFIIIGEAGGILDAMKLKGIDPAMKSGMLAAEAVIQAFLSSDFSAGALSAYEKHLMASWVGDDLMRSRNFHQGFHRGLIMGMIHSSLQFVTRGRGLIDRFGGTKPDAHCMKKLEKSDLKNDAELSPDGKTTFDKLSCVFGSGTKHEEDQPCHIIIDDMDICNGICREEFGNPCQYFCPANVFEMVREEDGCTRLHLNPANCLHCKTCDIKDPYEIVTWVPPEGGGGPNYRGM